MKNQNDLIAIIVAAVLSLIVIVVLLMTKRQEVAPTPPATVATSPAALPKAEPVMAASLPKGGSDKTGGSSNLPNFGGAGSAPAGIPGTLGGPKGAANGKKMIGFSAHGV